MRKPEDKHVCPLLNREILWGDCFEIQEIRNDDMDMELFSESFSLTEAEKICELCRWYKVSE